VPAQGIDADCATLEVDHCYDGWSGVALLRDEALRVKLGSNLSRLVVFAQPARDSIAIEPVSHVNNAVSLVHAGADAADLGLAVLQPGESISAQMTIEVERVQ
jgi:aldose 1-epimerase